MKDSNSKMMSVTGLWRNETKDGRVYLSGNWGHNTKILIFPNTKKEQGSKQPDYTFCLAPIEPKEKQSEEKDSSFFG